MSTKPTAPSSAADKSRPPVKSIKPTSKDKVRASTPGPSKADSNGASNKHSDPSISQLLGTNILLVGALSISAIVIATLAWRLMTSQVSVIAVTESGQIIQPQPLAKAFVTDTRVLSFAGEALRASFSHDFVNYRDTFATAKSQYYTNEGGASFAQAIDPILNDLRQRRLVMSAAPLKAPSLIRGPYLLGGRAVWEIQAPITLFYEGTQSRFPPQNRLATLKIVRVDLAESMTGIGVDSIQLSPYIEPR